jgi:hypothetical protein
MMSFLRSLAADLRERQVLPAVLLLVVLALAIPIFAGIALSKSSVPPPIPTAPVNASPPKGLPAPSQETLLAEAPPTQKWRVYKGTEPNPFRPAPTAASTTAASSTTTASTTPTPTPATTTPATTTPATTTPATTTPNTKTVTTRTTTSAPSSLGSDEAYAIDGTASYGSEQDTLDNIQRLTPLPANIAAEVVYLGVVKGGKRAAFLLTDAVAAKLTSSGSVKCVPSPSNCEVIELTSGEQLTLAPSASGTGISTFTFKLNSIHAQKFAKSAQASAARQSASATGSQFIAQSTSIGLASFFYSANLGALLYAKPVTAGSTGSSGVSGSSGSSGSSGVSNGVAAAGVPLGEAFESSGH